MTNRSLNKKVFNINSRARQMGCKGKISVDDIRKILNKCRNRCIYCGSDEHLTIDHEVPLCKGGQNTIDNIVIACSGCNSDKGNRTVEEFLNADFSIR